MWAGGIMPHLCELKMNMTGILTRMGKFLFVQVDGIFDKVGYDPAANAQVTRRAPVANDAVQGDAASGGLPRIDLNTLLEKVCTAYVAAALPRYLLGTELSGHGAHTLTLAVSPVSFVLRMAGLLASHAVHQGEGGMEGTQSGDRRGRPSVRKVRPFS